MSGLSVFRSVASTWRYGYREEATEGTVKQIMIKVISETIGYLEKFDPEVAAGVRAELARQQSKIELIASENFVSGAVLAANASVLTNKYAEGYPAHRYYGGCECVDIVENIARERACRLFGAEHANVQPHSGAQANTAVYTALIKPGDTVMGMNLACGGHLTHGSPVNISGMLYNFVPYGVNGDGLIDYDEVERIAKECRPKLIVAGASAYPRIIDFKRFGEIAKSVGAYLMVDMAHIAGLVAAGLHPSPVPYADVVTTTTHKTLRGPRGGMILCREELAKQIDKAIFPGTQGGPLMHTIAAKAVCLGEALKPEFTDYAKKIVANAKAFADGFSKNGFDMVSGGTDNHLILLDLRSFGITGKDFEHRLDAVNITTNKNGIPNDPQKPTVTSGLRVGTPAATTRGLVEEDFAKLAELFSLCASPDDESFEKAAEDIRREVKKITDKYPLYEEGGKIV